MYILKPFLASAPVSKNFQLNKGVVVEEGCANQATDKKHESCTKCLTQSWAECVTY